MRNLLALAVLLIVACKGDIAWGQSTLFDPNTKFVTLEDMSVEYFKYETHRDAYYPDYPAQGRWEGGSRVNYTLGLLRGFYWRNTLFFSYEKQGAQIRDAGWDWEAGVRVVRWLDLYKYHRSSHGLEYVHPDNLRFPVTDTFGFRIKLVH
jgi:hypothetical protein